MQDEQVFAVKDILYSGKGDIEGFPFSIHMNEVSNDISFCSKENKNERFETKISYAAAAVGMLARKMAGIADVSGRPASYVKLFEKNGEMPRALASYAKGERKFKIFSDRALPNEEMITVILSAFISNQMIRDSIGMDFGKDSVDEIMECVGKDPDKMERKDIFRLCDAFYYGIAANGLAASVKASDKELSPIVQRLSDAGVLTLNRKFAEISSLTKKEREEDDEKKEDTPDDEDDLTMPLDKFFEKCRKGAFVIDYPWNGLQKRYIVPLSFLDGFSPTEEFRENLVLIYRHLQKIMERDREYKAGLEEKRKKEPAYMEPYPIDRIIGPDPINVKFIGKPGTGKSYTIEAILAALGYPKGMINCKDTMEEDEIEGQNKFVNGTVASIPTKAGELHGIGGAIVLEEANLPNPGILQGALGQALYYPYILKIDGYMEVRRHPMTIYFLTMNVGTEGTKELNDAFSSRFPDGAVLNDMPRNAFMSVLRKTGCTEEQCGNVYDVYTQILNYLQNYDDDLILSVTMRHCISCLEKMKLGLPFKKAVERTFIAQLYSSDPKIAEDVKKTLPAIKE